MFQGTSNKYYLKIHLALIIFSNEKRLLYFNILYKPRVESCLDNTHIFTIYGHEDKRSIGTLKFNNICSSDSNNFASKLLIRAVFIA